MVVIAIIAIGTAIVGVALQGSGATQLAREADRLAALFEAARAQSRASGVPVRWRPTPEGFAFEGLPASAPPLPKHWLDAGTAAVGNQALLLGPEPMIGAQSVTLQRADGSGGRVTIATDGLRPFGVEPSTSSP